MSKTDKELTAEITIAFINSWNARPNTSVLDCSAVKDLITNIHSTLKKVKRLTIFHTDLVL